MHFSILKKKRISFKLFAVLFLFSMLCLKTTVQAAVPYTYISSETSINTLDITFDYDITGILDSTKITVYQPSVSVVGSSALRTPKIVTSTIDTTNIKVLHVTMGDLDPANINYEVKIEKDALNFGGVYTPLADFILPFSSKDFAYGFKSIFLTKTVSELNTNIFKYNSPRDISVYIPKKYITSIETIHKKDGIIDSNIIPINNYPKLTNIDVKTDKAVQRLKVSVQSTTGLQLAEKELLSTATTATTGFTTGEAGLDIDTGVEYTIIVEAFDIYGKRLEKSQYTKKLLDVKTEIVSDYINTKTSASTDKPLSLYDLMKTPATLTSMLQSIDVANLDLIKVICPNTIDTKVIIDSQDPTNKAINMLADALADDNIRYIKFATALKVTANQIVKLERPVTIPPTVGNIVMEGSGSTITGSVTIGGGVTDTNTYELRNISITGDLIIDIASTGDCIYNTDNVKVTGRIIVLNKKISSIVDIVSMDITNKTIFGITGSISIGVKFSEPIFVTGNPTLTLSNGGVAVYDKTSTEAILKKDVVVFKYIVPVDAAGDFLLGINANPIALNGGIIQVKSGASGAAGLNQAINLNFSAKLIKTATTNENILVDPLMPMVISSSILAVNTPIAPEVISCKINDILNKASAELPGNWRITDMGVTPNVVYTPSAVTLNGDQRTVTLVMKSTESTSLPTNIKVTMVSGITDKTGNLVDTTSPIPVLSFTNGGGASVATVRTGQPVTITATFNEDLISRPSIEGTGNNVLVPTQMIKVDSRHYTYIWTPLASNGYQTFALTLATDTAGNVITAVPIINTIKIDNAVPTFSSAFIVNNSVQPNTITIVANEALDATAANSIAKWTVTNNAGTIPYTIASAALQADNKTVVLTLALVNPTDNKTFITTAAAAAHIKVTPAITITDVAGNAYAGTPITDSGIPITDAIAPTVNAILTVTDLTHIKVLFSEKVDNVIAITPGNYVLSGTSCTLIPQTVTVADLQLDGKTVILTLSAPIDTTEGTILNVTVGAVTDVSGLLQSPTNNIATITN